MAILIIASSSATIQEPIFDTFDVIRGIASTIFVNAGADRLSDCMEDGDDIEGTIVKIELIIKNFNPKTIFQDLTIIFADIVSVYDDCKAFWTTNELNEVARPFLKMAELFKNEMGTFITKEVVAILAEGTNLMAQIADIAKDWTDKKFYEVGTEIGDIIAIFTVKLF